MSADIPGHRAQTIAGEIRRTVERVDSTVVDLISVSADARSVSIVYRHRFAPGVFGLRYDVESAESYEDSPDAESMATQIWYAELEPTPDTSLTTEVDGVRWWGDRPFPEPSDDR